MALPCLKAWTETAQSLHQAAQLIGALRMLLLEPVPNYLELGLKIVPAGLSSDILPGRGEVTLSFQTGSLDYRRGDGRLTRIPVNGQTQASLLQALLEAMQDDDLVLVLDKTRPEEMIGVFLAGLRSRQHPLHDQHAHLTGMTPLRVDPASGREYAEALYRIFTAVACFRSRLVGPMTPTVVWTEHFDLSMLWFGNPDMDDHQPHMNFGFAPFSPGFERPYLYAYAYPYPANFVLPDLPPPARWHQDGWMGVVVDYDEIATQPDPEGFIEQIYLEIFHILSHVLGEK